MRLGSTVTLFLLFCLVPASSQAPSRGPVSLPTLTEVRVHVSYTDDRPAKMNLRVQLLTSSELFLAEGFTDDLGIVTFRANPGNYRLRIIGADIEETTSPVFSIFRGDPQHSEFVRVAPKASASATSPAGSLGLVAAVDLNVPGKARKEYEKGGSAMEAGNLDEARKRLEAAVRIFPLYAAAHNDLGVVYMRTGDRQKGREAFARAIATNDRFARAHRNLAYMEIEERRYNESISLLEKVLISDPLDAETLALLAQVYLLNGRIDEALASARKVHSVPHEGQAVAHYIAARALEARNLGDEAAAEYRTFLKEAPNSASAPKARAALEKLTPKVN